MNEAWLWPFPARSEGDPARAVVLSLLVGLSVGSSPVGGQVPPPPCAGLVPIRNEQLQYRDRGNRCEGLYQREVSESARLELLSLTLGEIIFDSSQPAVLRLTPPSTVRSAIRVRAQAIPRGIYYQMDALIEPGQSLTWPVSDVLHPRQITAGRLGILGWLTDREPRIYVPMILQTET